MIVAVKAFERSSNIKAVTILLSIPSNMASVEWILRASADFHFGEMTTGCYSLGKN